MTSEILLSLSNTHLACDVTSKNSAPIEVNRDLSLADGTSAMVALERGHNIKQPTKHMPFTVTQGHPATNMGHSRFMV